MDNAEVGGLEYRGNSVWYWWAKAHAYGEMVHGVAPLLDAAGHPVNSSGADGAVGGLARAVEALILERDVLQQRVVALMRASREFQEAEAELACLKRGAATWPEPGIYGMVDCTHCGFPGR